MTGPEVKQRGITRRAFLGYAPVIAASGALLGACQDQVDIDRSPAIDPTTRRTIEAYALTLPRNAGATNWSGAWQFVSGPIGSAIIDGYTDQNGLFRHRVSMVRIPVINTGNQPLSVEQMEAVFKKEVNHIYAYEYIDTNLAQKLKLDKYPTEEVHVIADGLAALSLAETEQRILSLNYSLKQFNYNPSTNKPYYPDPESNAVSILKEGEYIVWDKQTLSYKCLAAIDIMSTRMKVINTQGIKTIGPDLLKLLEISSN